jgi:hypothetical protein
MDERLSHEIAKELCAQLPLRDGRIMQEDVSGVAFAVAARLWRAFRIEWSPDWDERPQDDAPISDLISPDAATYRGNRLENW